MDYKNNRQSGNYGGDSGGGYRDRDRHHGLQSCYNHPNRDRHQQRKVGFRQLEEMANKSEIDVVKFCCQKEFLVLLADEKIGEDWVHLMITCVEKGLRVDNTMGNFRNQIKDELLYKNELNFLKIACERLETEIKCSASSNEQRLMTSLSNYLSIYRSLCELDPNTRKKISAQIKLLGLELRAKVAESAKLPDIVKVNDDFKLVLAVEDKFRETRQAANSNQRWRDSGRIMVEEMMGEDFIKLPVYPTRDDIETPAKLRINKTEGKYKDAVDYLDVQFRLYREDFISSIREGIKAVREKPGLARKGRLHGNFRVYNNFHLVNTVLDDGIKHILQVDISDRLFSSGKWLKSKRLTYGALLCLSADRFRKQLHFATVVNRPRPHGRDDPTALQISFLDPDPDVTDDLMNNNRQLMVIESPVFSEAYQPVLEGLKTLGREIGFLHYPFPFERYLVRCEMDIHLPEYMKEPMQHLRLTWPPKTDDADAIKESAPDYRFGRIKKTDDSEYTDLMPVLDTSSWPPAEEMGFNESQYKAYKAALTQEFCLIQGPPGTGKTYVGLKIVKTLLRNFYHGDNKYNTRYEDYERAKQERRRLSPDERETLPELDIDDFRDKRIASHMKSPILLVCYTNHALDQFMEGILEFCHPEDIVRIGSKSKSEEIRKLNLNDKLYEDVMRQKKAHDALSNTDRRSHYGDNTYSRLHAQRKGLEQECQTLVDALYNFCNGAIISLEELATKNIIALIFRVQLDLKSQNEHTDSLVEWLGEKPGMMTAFKNVRHNTSSSKANKPPGSNPQPEDMSLLEDDELEEEYNDDDRRIDGIDLDLSNEGEDGMRITAQSISNIIFCDSEMMSKDDVTHLIKRCEANPDYVIGERPFDITHRSFSTRQRKLLYNYWLKEYHDKLRELIANCRASYVLVLEQQRDMKKQQRISALTDAKVIGMTTTGAARMQDVLQRVGPKIVIVEEAAEVLEAHIIAALGKSSEHLILIGISKPVFFLDHKEPETEDQWLISKSNKHEADMIVELTRYLLNRKYRPEQITIICMYKGQELMIRNMTRKESSSGSEFAGIRITSIDNFQGEENDIIIVSIVRSNKEDKLGFVKIENRICVTLSRAKLGMYVLGNFEFLRKGSEMWCKMIETAEHADELGDALKLGCEKHDITASIRYPADFREHVPLGGCSKNCNEVMDCGHICKMKCHYVDHSLVYCQEPCLRKCERGHPCQDKCYEKCVCFVSVTKKLSCGHRHKQTCNEWNYSRGPPCRKNCERVLPLCGHPCDKMCRDQCQEDCKAPVDRVCSVSICGEIKTQPCYLPFQCSAPCGEILEDCGHLCKGTCYSCQPDSLDSEKRIHRTCREPCGTKLECGHICRGECGSCRVEGDHKVCMELCGKTYTSCSRHTCTKQCFECDRVIMIMHSPDGTNKEERSVTEHSLCPGTCDEDLPCGHECRGPCKECSETGVHFRCSRECQKKLKCGHPCSSSNCSDCTLNGHKSCVRMCGKTIPDCGHKCTNCCGICSATGKCSPEECLQQCHRIMRCGHACNSKQCCGDCFRNGGCKEESCMYSCKMRCTHGNERLKKCSEECYFKHKGKFRATSCNIGCKPHQGGCKEDCDAPCSTKPCEKPCTQKTICTLPSCKKYAVCIGLCGDPCPQFCRKCVLRDGVNNIQGLDEKSINTNTLWVKLVDCGHVIPVNIMDQRVNSRKELNQVLFCPRKECKKLVLNTPRYMSVVRQARFERNKTLRRERKQGEKERPSATNHSRKRSSTLGPDHSSKKTRVGAPALTREDRQLVNNQAPPVFHTLYDQTRITGNLGAGNLTRQWHQLISGRSADRPHTHSGHGNGEARSVTERHINRYDDMM